MFTFQIFSPSPVLQPYVEKYQLLKLDNIGQILNILFMGNKFCRICTMKRGTRWRNFDSENKNTIL